MPQAQRFEGSGVPQKILKYRRDFTPILTHDCTSVAERSISKLTEGPIDGRPLSPHLPILLTIPSMKKGFWMLGALLYHKKAIFKNGHLGR
jgi:hypothetical protein